MGHKKKQKTKTSHQHFKPPTIKNPTIVNIPMLIFKKSLTPPEPNGLT